jgi:hypothetical protein
MHICFNVCSQLQTLQGTTHVLIKTHAEFPVAISGTLTLRDETRVFHDALRIWTNITFLQPISAAKIRRWAFMFGDGLGGSALRST